MATIGPNDRWYQRSKDYEPGHTYLVPCEICGQQFKIDCIAQKNDKKNGSLGAGNVAGTTGSGALSTGSGGAGTTSSGG